MTGFVFKKEIIESSEGDPHMEPPWNCALIEQLYTLKTSLRYQMNPKKFLYKTALSAQLPCLASRSL